MKKLEDIKSEFKLVLKGIKLVYEIQKSIIFICIIPFLDISIVSRLKTYLGNASLIGEKVLNSSAIVSSLSITYAT